MAKLGQLSAVTALVTAAARTLQTGSAVWIRCKLVMVLAALGLPALLNGCHPVPIVDAPASSLAVKITIEDYTATTPDGKVPVIMQFLMNGSPVKLADNATVTANRDVLTWNGNVSGYAGRVAPIPDFYYYAFKHKRDGVTSTVLVDMQLTHRLVILSPTAGATVTRSSNLPVAYVPGSGIGVRCYADDGSTARGGTVQPDNGTCSLDVLSFHNGPGAVSVTRELTITPFNHDFQSVTADYTIGARVTITWAADFALPPGTGS
jgi:hypothetical protein